MPHASGLFERAIVQSMPGTYFTPRLAADIAQECARRIGVAASDLPAQPAHRLPVAADAVMASIGEHEDRWGRPAYVKVPFAPVVDGEVLPSTPWLGLSGGPDVLVGHTRHEQRLLSAMEGLLGRVTAEQADKAVRRLAPDPLRYETAFPDPEERFDVVRSDWLFRMPSLALADAHMAAGGTSYLYELTWPAPGMGGILGACHGLDVPLVFGNLTVGQTAMLIGDAVDEALVVSRQMLGVWVDFATSGNPGWPPFDPRTAATRIFNVQPTVGPYPETVSREIWTTPPTVLDLP